MLCCANVHDASRAFALTWAGTEERGGVFVYEELKGGRGDRYDHKKRLRGMLQRHSCCRGVFETCFRDHFLDLPHGVSHACWLLCHTCIRVRV